MPSVSGAEFHADPEGHAERFVAELQAEAVALSVAPPRYVWSDGYWCAVKSNTGWPNVTGWAEHRETQRIYQSKLAGLRADGVPKASTRAREYAKAKMLARTTARKEASDRYYAKLEADIAREAGGDSAGDEPTRSSD
ncbi:hypothetical protein GS491_26465 [Rhodococcus hoagii]|nr:hypothetical protein [Prescottella equi]NKR80665.1 hypothetical protein [Prescottella equi]NKS99586.1 hypothetical protein [Prescottella equi]